MSYHDFLAAKRRLAAPAGRECHSAAVHPLLHPWQAECVAWAVRQGRAALWWDTGLGKTVAQVEWARLSADTSLIVAPLAVCQQTVREAAKIGVATRYVRGDEEITGPGVWVTSYEMVERIDPGRFGAVVLDEASILKQSDGKTRALLVERFAAVPARLACTATPAPNDVEELTNQAAFLGVASRVEMLAAYFVHDDTGWRLKGHAGEAMWRWVASWAIALRKPSDMGYPDDGYDLPPLTITPQLIPVDVAPEGQLFATDLGGVGGRAAVRRATLEARVGRAVELVNFSHGLAADGSKLAAWSGSPNTPSPDASATRPIPPNGLGESLRGGAPNAIANTCARTTPRTRNDSSSINGIPPSGVTPVAASVTRATPTTEPSASGSASSATRIPAETPGSELRSGSPHPNMIGCSPTNPAAAQSAEHSLATVQADDSSWTTATRPAGSEESFARPAISDSESSATTDPSSNRQSGTSALESWVVWCGLNDEQDALVDAFGDRCISLTGSQTPEQKVDALDRWLAGERPILVTKTAICGLGINMQQCARMAFVGLSDSYEAYYQAIRRCWRYGQTRPVQVHIVLSELESAIASNVLRKEREAKAWTAKIVAAVQSRREAA